MKGYAWEWKKLGTCWAFLLALALLLVRAGVSWYSLAPRDSVQNEEQYRAYCQRLQGPMTPEKRRYLDEEYERVVLILEAQSDMESAYKEGKISKEEFEAFNKQWFYAMDVEQAFRKIYDQAAYLDGQDGAYAALSAGGTAAGLYGEELSAREAARFAQRYRDGGPPEFLYDTGWEILLGDGEMDFLLLASVLVLCLPYLLLDAGSGMLAPVRATRSGRRGSLLRRLSAAVPLTALFALLSLGVELGIAVLRLELPSASAPVQSLAAFASCPHAWTLRQYLLWQCGTRLLGAVLLAVWLAVFSDGLHQPIALTVAAVLFALLPVVFRRYLPAPVYTAFPGLMLVNGALWNVPPYDVGRAGLPVGWAALAENLVLAAAAFSIAFFRRTDRPRKAGRQGQAAAGQGR